MRFSNTAFYINTLSSILGIDLVTFLIFKFGSQIYITFHPKLRRWICLFSSCIFISLSGWVFNRLQCSSFGIFIQLIHRLKRFLWWLDIWNLLCVNTSKIIKSDFAVEEETVKVLNRSIDWMQTFLNRQFVEDNWY